MLSTGLGNIGEEECLKKNAKYIRNPRVVIGKAVVCTNLEFREI